MIDNKRFLLTTKPLHSDRNRNVAILVLIYTHCLLIQPESGDCCIILLFYFILLVVLVLLMSVLLLIFLIFIFQYRISSVNKHNFQRFIPLLTDIFKMLQVNYYILHFMHTCFFKIFFSSYSKVIPIPYIYNPTIIFDIGIFISAVYIN